MNGLVIHVYDSEPKYCGLATDEDLAKKAASEIGEILGKPGTGSGGQGGSDNNFSDEEKEKLNSAVEELSAHLSAVNPHNITIDTIEDLRAALDEFEEHIERRDNPHEVKMSDIDGLQDSLEELKKALGSITPETINKFTTVVNEFRDESTAVQTVVRTEIAASSGAGTSVTKNEETGEVSLNVNVADKDKSSLQIVESTVENPETGETETKSELALGWVQYDNQGSAEESSTDVSSAEWGN